MTKIRKCLKCLNIEAEEEDVGSQKICKRSRKEDKTFRS
jgi:hypothetical protein